MKNVLGVMLSLVRNRLFGDDVDVDSVREIFGSEKLSRLYELSKFHDLSHLIGACIDPFMLTGHEEIIAKLKKAYFAAIYRYRGIEHELRKIKALFNDEGIAHIPLKGSIIRGYYPEPWMRTSCDVDILVKEEEVDRAADLLAEKFGYTKGEKSFHDISLHSPGGVHIELHFTLIGDYSYPRINDLLSDVWENAIRDGESYTYYMSNESFYFYHIAHMMKHFLSGGCGIRSFIDLYMLDTRLPLDRDKVDGLLCDAGLLEYARKSSGMARIWLRDEPSDELYDTYEKYIINGGVYGTKESKIIIQRERKGGKFRYLLRRIFLPYRSLKELFPILKKHKWLTPVFEVVRWFKLIFGGKIKSSYKELRTNAAVTEKEAASAAFMLKGLGLDGGGVDSEKNG